MSTVKYQYNSKTFQYERARPSIKDGIWYVSGLLCTAVLICCGMLAFHDAMLETETERVLRRENNLLEKHKPVLEEELASANQTLEKLKKEDRLLYSRLFNSDPPEAQTQRATLSKEQALLADPADFKNLLDILKKKSTTLFKRSAESNQAFGNTIKITKAQLDVIASIPSIQPIDNAQLDFLVSGFGERINPFHKGRYNHPGLDFAAARGTAVFVTAPGKVVAIRKTQLEAGYGNYIDVDHGNGFVTRYAHLEDILVRRGQSVPQGTTIGTVGNSGGSIAPHLHYEVIHHGEPVDPVLYLMDGLSSEQHHALLNLSSKLNQSLD